MELCEKAAQESIVLLKNNGVLPLNKREVKTIGVIGPNANNRSSLDGNYHGTASRYVTILEGIQDYVGNEVRILYSQGSHLYLDKEEQLAQKDDRISEALSVTEYCDVVILCVGLDESLEGEEGDTGNAYASGDKKDLEFPQGQKRLMDAVLNTDTPVIVCNFTGSAMNLSLADEKAAAVIQAWYPGAQGGAALAKILFGEVSPSGKLPVTFYQSLDTLPAFEDYSMRGRTYRYLEEKPLYPFGYGLSYTTFSQTLDSLDVNLEDKTVTAKVTVKNTGDVAGKDVVQLYTSLPYTEYDKEHAVEKAAVQLLDYEKTGVLQPGESVTVEITADAQDMASWDSTCDNAAGTKGNWILDAGDYYFTVGNGSHEAVNNVLAAQGMTKANGMTDTGNAANVKKWILDTLDSETFAYSNNGTAVENQLQDMDLNYYMPDTVTYLSRSDWKATWPKTYKDLTATDEMIEVMKNDLVEIKEQGNPDEVTFGEDNGLTLASLKGETDLTNEKWTDLIDQITLEEAMIRTGFGGTSTKSIVSIVSPEAVQNDGPNGFNSYTLGQYANTDTDSADPYVIDPDDKNLNYKFGTMSNETVIAQTFSKEMAAEYGAVTGNYSIWSNLPILWGAGTNLHRTPYNARNHEYYSEDAILTAYQAAAYIAAGKEYGCIIAPKHFAFNDTEINRSGIATFMTEQKARENELRGTQASVEDAQTLGMMTTFNRIGCTAGNAHYGLLMNILRKEWGFQGLMSEDFIQDANYSVLKEAVHCGVTMTCNTGDSNMEAVTAKWNYWTTEAVSKDASMMQDLKNVMMWQNYALANSNAMDGLNETSQIKDVRTWYDNALTATSAVLALLTLAAAAMYIRDAKRRKNS